MTCPETPAAETGTAAGDFGQRTAVRIALLVAGAMTAAILLLFVGSWEQDRLARDASIRLAASALQAQKVKLKTTLVDYGWWTDAFIHLHQVLNREWADVNIKFINDTYHYEITFVLDPADRTVYAVVDGEVRTDVDASTLLSGGFDRLIRQARMAPMNEPVPAVGLLAADGGSYIVGVSAIAPQPDELALLASQTPGSRSLLVVAEALDADFLGSIGDSYLLRGLRHVAAAEAAPAKLPLTATDGTPLGVLAWDPERPGRELLHRLLPILATALMAIAVFTGLVLRNARRAGRAVAASEARFRDVAEASSDWIWEADAALRLTWLSRRFVAVTGLSPETALGRELGEFLQPDEGEGLPTLAARQPFRGLRCRYRDAQGEARVCRLAGRPILGPDGTFLGYRGTASDITAEVAAQERAQHLSLHDALTGLPNRLLLAERLEAALAARRSDNLVAVLCLDLDRFKEVNDSLGHAAGDLLLREATGRLLAAVRETDTVARLGGDEFAIVQGSIGSPADAQALCRRLLDGFAAPVPLDGHEVFVRLSIGIALAPGDGDDPEQLLKHADTALYRAKEESRGTFRFFEAGMDARLQARKALERDLRQALPAGQLEVYYQPKMAAADGRLLGTEALVRWHHPERGMVSPGEFIPLAEETGLIVPIGAWVLKTACAQAARWPGVHVAVNLSAVQIRQDDLVERVETVLRDTGIEPSRLELEITESMLLQDTAATLALLHRLKSLGVRLSMDDFGTGYSSLSYLQSFPFDKIKIDQNFVRRLGSSADAQAIVRAVLGLGRSLGMATNAEGVETAEQLAFLRTEGCDEVQGFYFSRPVPPAELERLLPPGGVAARRTPELVGA